jgi:TolA-binding protein
MKEAGINTIRLYGIPPEFILDLADKYNIKVIETIVFPGDWTDFTSPYQLQALKREAIRNIDRDIDRECIYAWSIWNDAPWTYGSGKGDVIRAYGKERVSHFLKELYEAVKKHDPLRPVTAATLTLNEDAKRLGADFLDILGYNIYLGVADWRDGQYKTELAEKMVDELVSISHEYNKPIIITETGYSTYWTDASQEDVIRDQIQKASKKLDGIILFQWADDWSKSGDAGVQNDNIEEHWGIVDGTRNPKGGYYAAKQMFRNTLFRSIMLAISDYCRGTYFATKKRTLKKRWKEEIIVDEEIEKLQNQLNLKPTGKEIPTILNKLSEKFFKKKGFEQFISYLKDYKSSYEQSPYIGVVNYYIVLGEWNKLEYLADNRMWELYYAEKTRHLDEMLRILKMAEEETKGTEVYLAVLYLNWLIHNDLLSGMENIALERLEQEVRNYSKSTTDLTSLLMYSQLLKEQGEYQHSEKLLREYVANIGKLPNPSESASLLREKAEVALARGDFSQAKILYDAYLNIVIRNYSEEDASFAMLELATLYKRQFLYDESIEVCKRLLKEFPNSELADDAAYAIGAALKAKRTYSKAIKAFHNFIVEYPDSDLSISAVKEALSIFTVYGKGTRASKTVSFLKEIIALYPDSEFSVMARFELASSLAILGRREEAVREYQYIIDNYPDSDFANYSKINIERLQMGE